MLAADIKPTNGLSAADTYGIAFMRAVCNMGADGVTIGRAIPSPVDRHVKDALEPNWVSETGTTIYEIVFDKNLPLQFFVSPGVPASPTVWARLSWMANPPALPDGGAAGAEKYIEAGSEAARVIGVPDQYAEDLRNYMVAVLLTKGSKNTLNLPKAQLHAGWFINSINQQALAQTGVNPNVQMLPYINEIAS